MKKLLTIFTALTIVVTASAKQTIRQILTFDQGWQFHLCKDKEDVDRTLRMFDITDNPLNDQTAKHLNDHKTKVTDDTEPEQAQVTASEITNGKSVSSFTDAAGVFRPVQIPHDWSSELPFEPSVGGSAGYLPGGQGVYVKEFELPKPQNFKTIEPQRSALCDALTKRSDSKNLRYAIAFDGVYHRATVWINGHRLGYHVYGYTGFEFDMTPYINQKGKNRIVVHVNREEQSRWYTGSGIYRHVWLKVTSASHLKTNGICIQTDAEGTVNITAAIDTAATDKGKAFKVRNTILDADGKVVKGKVNRRWSVDDPYLYTALTQLYDSRGNLIDEVRTHFGYRTFHFDADKGFFLNDKPMKLKGMCLHQDAGSLGTAVPEEVWLRRLKALKDIGCNSIRCSHNPPSPEFLDICDSLGLLVIDEAFDKWKSGYYAPFFEQCAKGDITDMVMRDRNHPSVIVWSIGNELQEAWSKTEEGVERARMLHELVKTLDPTRPTLVACQQGFEDKFGEVTDLVGYNYLEPRMIADHKRHPNRKMMVTEAFVYYSGLRENLVRDFVEENPWHFVEENDFIAGSYIWAGVDYLGESSPWPAKGWCSCPFDMTLKERPQAAYYRQKWTTHNDQTTKQPNDYLKLVVRDNCFDQAIGTDHWQYPPMADTWDLPYTDSRCVQIRCYTTCDSVQFFFPMWSNPQLPLKPRVAKDYPDHCITLQLPARQGKVLAVGYKDGKEVLRDSLVNHGDVADVRLVADHTILQPLPKDMSESTQQNTVSHIRILFTDKEGRLQQMQPRKFRVETEGAVRLLGVETGDMRRQDSWRTTELTTYFGEGLIRLQSTSVQGTGRVKVYVEGFEKPFVKEIEIAEKK